MKIIECEPAKLTPEYAAQPGWVVDVPSWRGTPEGDALDDLRVALGLTVAESAERAGLSLTSFAGLLSGRLTFSAEDWRALRSKLEAPC